MPLSRRSTVAVLLAVATVAGCGDDPRPDEPERHSLPTPQTYAETCALEPQACSWTGPGDAPDRIERPFHHPAMGANGECPASEGKSFRSAVFSGTVLGAGPVRPLVAAGPPRKVRRGTVTFLRGEQGWWGAKTLWFARRSYQGPVLIRGRRIDAPGVLAFGEQPAALAREIPPGPDHTVNVHERARHWPGSTWVRRAGCYAWQVDGEDFGTTIVFRAVLP